MNERDVFFHVVLPVARGVVVRASIDVQGAAPEPRHIAIVRRYLETVERDWLNEIGSDTEQGVGHAARGTVATGT